LFIEQLAAKNQKVSVLVEIIAAECLGFMLTAEAFRLLYVSVVIPFH